MEIRIRKFGEIKMTRKDYIEIAKVLNNNLTDTNYLLIEKLTKDFSTILKNDNPNFDATRFENAVMK
jgi:dihydroneopterin aldolase